jgi:hypothetical protein
MKNLIIIALMYFLLTSSSCDKFPVNKIYGIEFKNNTSSNLSIGASFRFPDTIPYSDIKIITISSGRSNYIDASKPWEDEINKIPGKKLQIFVFSVSKISPEWNWDSVITKYQVLKRYELTSQQLKDLNYTVSYP